MIVAAFVDPMGTSHETEEDEYDYIKYFIENVLEKKVIFKKRVRPDELGNQPCDIYFFDWGGLTAGMTDTVNSYYFELIRQIEDHPDTLFILWSAFTERWYRDLMEESFDGKQFHNVVNRDTNEIIIKLIKMGYLEN